MGFEVRDYFDLIRLLEDHPQWRAELRRLLLTDELLTLPELVRELAEAQRRTEQRVEELAEAQRHLAEAQRRTEQRVEELAEAQRRTEEAQRQLEEAQRRTEERLNQLTVTVERLAEEVRNLRLAQQQTDDQIRNLVQADKQIADRVNELRGQMLEIKYRDRAGAYFGRLLRRPQVVSPDVLWDEVEPHLSRDDFSDVLLLDLIVRGRPISTPEAPEVWLAVEISAVVDTNDVTRARRRAELLRRAGQRVIPVVAGERATLSAEAEARQYHVAMLQDGRAFLWDEALHEWTR
ncbi:MAG: hypothetical protein RMM98_01075 [Acidobacteriota bacterium]|nr:hypothetical protein [Blastocatellia bacterium]MDW8238179.1 hypothetical protein [Acidobacteriota bacterium]